MRILDIGTYDGHTSVQIEKRLPFKEIISLEPRRKNFLKGKFVRDYLKFKLDRILGDWVPHPVPNLESGSGEILLHP